LYTESLRWFDISAMTVYIKGEIMKRLGPIQGHTVNRRLVSWARSAMAAVLVATLLASGSAVATAQEKGSVEVAGLTIAKKDPNSEFGGSFAMGRPPGLEVDLAVAIPKSHILMLDGKKSSLKLTTPKGVELPLDEYFDGKVNFQIGNDHARAVAQIRATELPPQGTTTLKVTGELVFIIGQAPKTEKGVLTLEQGAKIKIAGIDAEISQVSEAFSDPYKKMFELSAKSAFNKVSKVTFIDAGKEVESSSGGSGSFGFGSDVTYSQSYQIASESKKLDLEVTYFSKAVEVKIPVSLEFGLGL
jgi:hypothetical protein